MLIAKHVYMLVLTIAQTIKSETVKLKEMAIFVDVYI